jgi:murein DD-endopeptidase MepM/ murein hydrolase activator NlpD
LALCPLLGACDWPTPPEVTIPPPVTWTTEPAAVGEYQVPVEGVVVDPFRAPAHRYGPGNRGIEYGTDAGTSVRASQAGTVGFAGPVAGRTVVAIEHRDGRRTTYTGLAALAVTRGDTVTAGQEIGTAGSSLHFGVKVGDEYVDPALLFGPPAVALVPGPAITD